MPNFKYPVMDSKQEVLNICQNIIDDVDPIVYRQVISGPYTHLWPSRIEVGIDALHYNHPWNVFDRPIDRMIIDSKLGFKIQCRRDGSVDRTINRTEIFLTSWTGL
jgi:hypothetical protein